MRNAGRATSLCVGLIVLVAAQTALLGQSSTPTPPTDLKLVGDHWTPWDPPEAAEGAYIIQKGDTLWDLSGKWLGDPFLWPQVWDENRYILDSHWIYPGDPLVIPGTPTVVPEEGPPPAEELDEPSDAVEEPAEEPTEPTPDHSSLSGGFGRKPTGEHVVAPEPRSAVPTPAPLQPLAGARDIYCAGRIVPEYEPSGLSIIGVEDERIHMSDGDVVIVDHGLDRELQPGDEFSIVRPTRMVDHPESGKRLGTFVRRVGKARVMLVQPTTATVVIQKSCEDIRIGDAMVPWETLSIPMGRKTDVFDRYDPTPSGGVTGVIVTGADQIHNFATGHVVQTDLGVASGIKPGDRMTVYRPRGSLPRANLGRAVVLSVEPNSSTVKIFWSVREMFVGDFVEIANN